MCSLGLGPAQAQVARFARDGFDSCAEGGARTATQVGIQSAQRRTSKKMKGSYREIMKKVIKRIRGQVSGQLILATNQRRVYPMGSTSVFIGMKATFLSAVSLNLKARAVSIHANTMVQQTLKLTI